MWGFVYIYGLPSAFCKRKNGPESTARQELDGSGMLCAKNWRTFRANIILLLKLHHKYNTTGQCK